MTSHRAPLVLLFARDMILTKNPYFENWSRNMRFLPSPFTLRASHARIPNLLNWHRFGHFTPYHRTLRAWHDFKENPLLPFNCQLFVPQFVTLFVMQFVMLFVTVFVRHYVTLFVTHLVSHFVTLFVRHYWKLGLRPRLKMLRPGPRRGNVEMRAWPCRDATMISKIPNPSIYSIPFTK